MLQPNEHGLKWRITLLMFYSLTSIKVNLIFVFIHQHVFIILVWGTDLPEGLLAIAVVHLFSVASNL